MKNIEVFNEREIEITNLILNLSKVVSKYFNDMILTYIKNNDNIINMAMLNHIQAFTKIFPLDVITNVPTMSNVINSLKYNYDNLTFCFEISYDDVTTNILVQIIKINNIYEPMYINRNIIQSTVYKIIESKKFNDIITDNEILNLMKKITIYYNLTNTPGRIMANSIKDVEFEMKFNALQIWGDWENDIIDTINDNLSETLKKQLNCKLTEIFFYKLYDPLIEDNYARFDKLIYQLQLMEINNI